MPPKVKICGLTRPQDVEAAIRYGACYVGFIIEAKSSRRLTVDQAATLSLPAKSIAATVAVVVNPENDLIRRIASVMDPDFIQLHGDETPERVEAIRKIFKGGIIKALSVSEPADLAAMSGFKADLILLDAKAPKGEARGGHGKRFDWSILSAAPLPETWLLAGGLTPATAARAAAQIKAPILDVSSGVESAPGVKCPNKIRDFFKSFRD